MAANWHDFAASCEHALVMATSNISDGPFSSDLDSSGK